MTDIEYIATHRQFKDGEVVKHKLSGELMVVLNYCVHERNWSGMPYLIVRCGRYVVESDTYTDITFEEIELEKEGV